MREFNVIDSATSVDQLRMRLKENDFEQFGDAFIPEFVYDVIKRLPRFSTMRVGCTITYKSDIELTPKSVVINKMPRNFWASY